VSTVITVVHKLLAIQMSARALDLQCCHISGLQCFQYERQYKVCTIPISLFGSVAKSFL